MSCGEALKELLRPLGVYQLKDSFLGAELECLGGAMDLSQNELERVQRETSLITAEDEGLERVASLFVRRPVASGPRQLAAALAALLRIGGDSFTLAAINDTIAGCGLNAAVTETGSPNTVEVRFPEVAGIPNGFEEMQQIIEDILPAHLLIRYVFWYQTWALLESRGLTWRRIEENNTTWKQLETMVQ